MSNIPTIIIGNSIYQKCPKCAKWVKVNKLIFGSLHLCDSEQESDDEQ